MAQESNKPLSKDDVLMGKTPFQKDIVSENILHNADIPQQLVTATPGRILQDRDLFPSKKHIPPNSIKKGNDFALSGSFYLDSTSNTVGSSTVETTLKTVTIRGNSLHNGCVLRMYTGGTAGLSQATSDLTVRLKVNGTTLTSVSLTNETTPSGTGFGVTWYVTILNTGTGGTLGASATGAMYEFGLVGAYSTLTSINTMQPITFTITAQLSFSSGGDGLTISQFLIEALN